MLSSELSRKITIEKKTYSKNSFSEAQESWSSLYPGSSIAAKIIWNTGKKFNNDQITTNISDVEFWIRRYPNINYDIRVKLGSTIYTLDYIEEIGIRGQEGYKLKCTRSEQDA